MQEPLFVVMDGSWPLSMVVSCCEPLALALRRACGCSPVTRDLAGRRALLRWVRCGSSSAEGGSPQKDLKGAGGCHSKLS